MKFAVELRWARSGGVTYWPKIIKHLLRIWATPAAISNFVNDLPNIRQQPLEEELTYSKPKNEAVHRCGFVHDKIDKMTLFLTDSHRVIRRSSPAFWESKGRRRLPYEKLVQYGQDEGESDWARIASLRVARIVYKNPKDRDVHLIEPNTTNGRSVENNELLYLINIGLVLNNELPARIATPSSQPLLFVGNHIRRKQPVMVRPKQLAAKDRDSFSNRPEWAEPRKKIICYQRHEINNHISQVCLAKLNDMDLVERNWEKLTDEQKLWVPSDTCNIVQHYLKMKRDHETNTRNSDEQPQNDPKN